MKIHLSSLCSRKKLQYIFKLIVIIVLVNFLGYVIVINFNQTNYGQNVNPFALQRAQQMQEEHNYEKKKFEEFVKKKNEKQQNILNKNDNEVDEEESDDEDNMYCG